jgi:hypothetical protein
MTDHTELKLLAEAAGSVEWKWWDSNSTLRLTTDINGRHGADGDAISAYQDSVQCPDVFRAFIEAANPAVVLALLDDLDEARNGMKYACAMRLKKEIDRLQAENEALRSDAEQWRALVDRAKSPLSKEVTP